MESGLLSWRASPARGYRGPLKFRSLYPLSNFTKWQSSLVKSNKYMKRMESKKSHSWWWDSHISPKNSKWLAGKS
ncbi:hypothetical protein F0562_002136 [Nyssa sinensis]|uniref:NAB domain-containing protein n=1 Tax=Nyssa sinensis TaxID=561372 RepID=A0A5J5C8V2_9ASTE|nr:hypothetical protein F0562_002136 [Nyssa sinensis]